MLNIRIRMCFTHTSFLLLLDLARFLSVLVRALDGTIDLWGEHRDVNRQCLGKIIELLTFLFPQPLTSVGLVNFAIV